MDKDKNPLSLEELTPPSSQNSPTSSQPETKQSPEDWMEEKIVQMEQELPQDFPTKLIPQLVQKLDQKARLSQTEISRTESLFNLKPLLVVDGEGDERLGLTVHDGFIVALASQNGEKAWTPIVHIPPKLLAYMDTFMAQHYALLNNRYGIPHNGTPKLNRA